MAVAGAVGAAWMFSVRWYEVSRVPGAGLETVIVTLISNLTLIQNPFPGSWIPIEEGDDRVDGPLRALGAKAHRGFAPSRAKSKLTCIILVHVMSIPFELPGPLSEGAPSPTSRRHRLVESTVG